MANESAADPLDVRVIAFALKFTQYFVETLKEQHQVALKEARLDVNKVKGAEGAKLVGKALGAAAGVGLGVLTGVFGAFAGLKQGAKLGTAAADKLVAKKGMDEAAVIQSKLGDELDCKTHLKRELVALALHVFSHFEPQLTRVTAKAGEAVAMAEMARDAVVRMFSFLAAGSEGEEEQAGVFSSSRDLLCRALLRGKSSGLLGKGAKVKFVGSGKEVSTGDLFELPGVCKIAEVGTNFYSTPKSKEGLFSFRLAFAFEADWLTNLDYCAKIESEVEEEPEFVALNWPGEKMARCSEMVLKRLESLDEKISILEEQFHEATELMVDNQRRMMSQLDDLEDQIASVGEEAEARDLKIQGLLVQQGNLIRGQVGSAAAAAGNLGKWWPQKQVLEEASFVERSGKDSGSESVLEDLHRKLMADRRVVVLTGMGGIGKTTTVRWFARTFEFEFDHVVWLDCEGEAMDRSVLHLADELSVNLCLNDGVTRKGLEAVWSDVAKALNGRRCLFLLDNVDNEKSASRVLSERNKHYSLLTSRLRRWKQICTVEVGLFSRDDAKIFLKKSLSPGRFDSGTMDELVNVLHCLPLAMAQAAACIERLDWTAKEYLVEFRSQSGKLLGYSESSNTAKTVLTTWKMSIKRVEADHGEAGALALKILNMMAYLYPEDIPKKLFYGMPKMGKFEIGQSLDLLSQYSLVNVAGDAISIHRLVQETLRISQQKEDEGESSFVEVAKLLLDAVSKNYVNNPLTDHLKTAAKFVSREKHPDVWLAIREVEAALLCNDSRLREALELQEANVRENVELFRSRTHLRSLESRCRLVNVRMECSPNDNLMGKILGEELAEIERDVEEKYPPGHERRVLFALASAYFHCKQAQKVPSLDLVKMVASNSRLRGDPSLKALALLLKTWSDVCSARREEAAKGFEALREFRSANKPELGETPSTKRPSVEENERRERARVRSLIHSLRVCSRDLVTKGERGATLKFLRGSHRVMAAEVYGLGRGQVFGVEFAEMVTAATRALLSHRENHGEIDHFYQCVRDRRASKFGEDHSLTLEVENLIGLTRAMRIASYFKTVEDFFEKLVDKAEGSKEDIEEQEMEFNSQLCSARLGKAFAHRQKREGEKGLAELCLLREELCETAGPDHPVTQMVDEHLEDVTDEDEGFNVQADAFETQMDAFVFAAEINNQEFFQKLLEEDQGFDYKTSKTPDGDTLLHFFARTDKRALRDALVDRIVARHAAEEVGAVVNEKNARGDTVLMTLVKNGDGFWLDGDLRFVFDLGSDVNHRNMEDMTALEIAAFSADKKAVRSLLRHPEQDLLTVGQSGRTALHALLQLALATDDFDIWTESLTHYKDSLQDKFDSFLRSEGGRLLKICFDGGRGVVNPSFAASLADEGAKADDPNALLESPAKRGDRTMTDLAVKMGARLDPPGSAPLLLAAEHAPPDYGKYLLDEGDVTLNETNGAAVIWRAVANGDADALPFYLDRLELNVGKEELAAVLNSGANPPLLRAVSLGKSEAVRTLLTRGADAGVVTTAAEERNALHLLALREADFCRDTYECLLEASPGLKERADGEGNSPLMLACLAGNVEMVTTALEEAAAAAAVNHRGENLLHLSVRSGRAGGEAVKAVLDSGQGSAVAKKTLADSTDGCGYTPLHRATASHQHEATEVLLEVGADKHAGRQNIENFALLV